MITKISIAKDFSKTPGGRKIASGPHSAELFRTKILIGAMAKAIENNEKVEIDLDGTYGIAVSFLDEAFTGLLYSGFTAEQILNTLVFKFDEEPQAIEMIRNFIHDSWQNLRRDQ